MDPSAQNSETLKSRLDELDTFLLTHGLETALEIEMEDRRMEIRRVELYEPDLSDLRPIESEEAFGSLRSPHEDEVEDDFYAEQMAQRERVDALFEQLK
jgi:hypothetical protein